MMTYTVKYKKSFLWHTIKNVHGDGIIHETGNRYFILDDESRIEIPSSALFWFSKERFISIKKNMEKQAGQPIG